MSSTQFECGQCWNPIKDSDDYCIHCGALLIDGITCQNHPSRAATGVCVICSLPCCASCGEFVNCVFLCETHATYEIYEGMARVYGSSDSVQVDFSKTCLQEAGLHPFVYSRKASAISMGGPDYTLFRASGDYDGHIINEFKLLVPCHEVLEAEQRLKELKILR
jgi:hypothetical protein